MEKRNFIDDNNNKIQRAKEIQDMMNSKGWKYVEQILDMYKSDVFNSKDETVGENWKIWKILDNFVKSLEDMVNDGEMAIKENIKLK